MLQIINPTSAGTCKIRGAVQITKDPDDGEAYQAKAKLRFVLDEPADAAAWEGSEAMPVLPGLQTLFELAQVDENNAKWVIALKDDRELMMELVPQRGTEQAGQGYKGGARITSVRASLSKKLCVVDCSVSLGGIEADEVEHVTRLLRGLVDIRTENRQVEMFEGQALAAL